MPELPFESGFFNLIHASHIVEHLPPDELYEFLKEVDRCLTPGGVFVISAPLLWSEFYADLSHLKPYNPKVFVKYLCDASGENLTRPKISSDFSVERLVYIYVDKSRFDGYLSVYNIRLHLLNVVLRKVSKFKQILGFRNIERNGFTLVLKKREPSSLSDLTSNTKH